MPVLIWGPMNQVEGLRETIALAIRLNRTVVIPPMYRHFTGISKIPKYSKKNLKNLKNSKKFEKF